jgi:hypothetical protein
VSERVPPVPAAGVPASVPVPSPLSVNDTPAGSAPLPLIAAVGEATVVTANVPGLPTVNGVVFGLVKAGALFTVSVKVWTTVAPTPLLAVNVSAYVPPVPAAAVPLSVPVPSPLSTHVIPAGRAAPPRVIVGTLNGNPAVVTANVPAAPTEKVVAAALVIAGGAFTVRMKLCVAEVGPPLSAVNVST